jgi:glycosyltransferase involved in cell wall biosynthesis
MNHRRPKILHLMTWLAPGGGADQNVYLTMREHASLYDQHLCVGCEISDDSTLMSDPEIAVRICPHMVRAISPWKDLLAFFWIYRLIRQERYDIVHTHETKASLLGRLAARLAGCPFVIYGLHGVVFNDPLSPLVRKFYVVLEQLTVGVSDLIVSVSRDAIRHYHRARIGRSIPWRVVYNGVDVSRFELGGHREKARRQLRDQLGIPRDATVAISVGRFSIAKAQRHVISAFARLNRPNTWLMLVGEGPERDACEQQATGLGISDRCRFLGYRADIPHCFAAADLHLLTSLREGLPRAVVEASLSKVPSVCFDVEGVREILCNGQSGCIVASGDLDQFIACVQDLLQDTELRQKMGEKAYAHAVTHWDHHQMARELDTIYRRRDA